MITGSARAGPIFKCAIALLLPVVLVIACSGHHPTGETVAHTSEHIWNGKPLPVLSGETDAQSAARHGVVKLDWTETDTKGVVHSHGGSSAVLSPSWLLTAAHVVTKNYSSGIADSVLANISGSAVTISKGEIYVNPAYDTTLGPHLSPFDAALLHVPSGGLTALGVSSTFLRPISATLPDDFLIPGLGARCVGYGPLALNGADQSYPHYADFNLFYLPPSGFLESYRGGGDYVDQNSPPTLWLPGDSGGPCGDFSDPSIPRTQFSIIEGVTGPKCTGGATDGGADAGTDAGGDAGTEPCICWKVNGQQKCIDPQIGLSTPAANFRDWVYSIMYSVYPPLHVDLDGDTILDTVGVETEANSTLRVYLQLSGTGTTYYFPPKTFPGIPTSALSLITALVNAAKFNGSTKDLFALVAGVPVYVTFDSSGAPTYQSTFTLLKSYEYFTSGDFDRDGYDDVELVSSDGSSDVIYGSNSGLGNPEGGVPRAFDFNGDGTEDVAITGMDSVDTTVQKRAYVLSKQDTPLYTDTTETDANFGRSVAWGDLDGNGSDELIVGAPGTSVHVISPTQDVALPAFSGSNMGASVAAGDFNGDGIDDLAMLASKTFTVDQGAESSITFKYGAALILDGYSGFFQTSTYTADQAISADTFGIQGTSINLCLGGGGSCIMIDEAGFGYASATGDFDCDGYEDLAVGAPVAQVGSLQVAGAVGVVYGSKNGLDTARTQLWTADSAGFAGATSVGWFGASLAAGNFNGMVYQGRPCIDLAVGAPRTGEGEVFVIDGGPGGLHTTGPVDPEDGASENGLHTLIPGQNGLQDVVGVYPPYIYGNFGESLAITRANNDRFDDLAIGEPGDSNNQGAVYVLAGSDAGPVPGIAFGFDLNDAGMHHIFDEGDMLGTTLGASANGAIFPGLQFADVPPATGCGSGGADGGGASGGASGVDGGAGAGGLDGGDGGAQTCAVKNAGEVFAIQMADAPDVDIATDTQGPIGGVWREDGPPMDGSLVQFGYFGAAISSPRPAFVRARERPQRIDVTGYLTSGTLPSTPVDCTAAVATPAVISPANSKLVPVTISGVVGTAGPAQITVKTVSQDEPVEKAPAAVLLGGASIQLRARRDPRKKGGGRVYHIRFRAEDSNGRSCAGQVRVCVPLHKGETCVDGGALYLSTG